MPVKVSVKDGKISNQPRIEKRLERFSEPNIVGEANDFGMDLPTSQRVDFGAP